LRPPNPVESMCITAGKAVRLTQERCYPPTRHPLPSPISPATMVVKIAQTWPEPVQKNAIHSVGQAPHVGKESCEPRLTCPRIASNLRLSGKQPQFGRGFAGKGFNGPPSHSRDVSHVYVLLSLSGLPCHAGVFSGLDSTLRIFQPRRPTRQTARWVF
jgi:hypothetical protein